MENGLGKNPFTQAAFFESTKFWAKNCPGVMKHDKITHCCGGIKLDTNLSGEYVKPMKPENWVGALRKKTCLETKTQHLISNKLHGTTLSPIIVEVENGYI